MFNATNLNIGAKVEKVNGKKLSYEDFVERYLRNNQPVVLSGLMDDWRASKEWVTNENAPNLLFFSTHCANSTVQVADCSVREFTDQKRVEMSVSSFIDHWQKVSSERNIASNAKIDEKSLLYLKDWHFVKEYPCYAAYETPPFFTDDWLNIYLDSYSMHEDVPHPDGKEEISSSDYRFVYMGAKGTWTPLHADVFRSYSWSANVCGRKLWLLLPPPQCHLIFERYLKRCVYDISADVSDKKFPGFKETSWWECTQEKDDIIFVPSGWYHQVFNLEDTISINHNWFNGYNLSWVWNLLLRDYNEAKYYIEDIRGISDDFEGLCQRNLAVNTGMNFYDFFIFMVRFSLANMIHLLLIKRHGDSITLAYAEQSLLWNVMVIRHVLVKMQSSEAFSPENLQRRCTDDKLAALFDANKILEEQRFSKLYEAVGRRYGMWKMNFKGYQIAASNISGSPSECHVADHSIEDFKRSYIGKNCSNQILDPEALVRLIDEVLTNESEFYGYSRYSLLSKISNLDVSTVI